MLSALSTNISSQGFANLTAAVFAFFSLLFIFRALSARLDSRLKGNRLNDPTLGADVWARREALNIVEIKELTPDIRSFTFQRQNGLPFSPFLGGQFISFQIGTPDTNKPVKARSYSISSSPNELSRISVAIKKIPNGVGSSWFHSLKVGDLVDAHPPAGHFVDNLPISTQRIYIAGGIGLTPFMSMVHEHQARATRESKMPTNVSLFYGARTQKDLAYHSELKTLTSNCSWLRYFTILSNADDATFDRGFLKLAYIKSKTTIAPDAHFFFCGPTVMTEALIAELIASGVSDKRIHLEKFVSPLELDSQQVPHREASIVFKGKSLKYSGQKTILEFLEEQVENISSACRVGVCGTCRCSGHGRVKMLTDAGLTTAEKQKGEWLACVSYPLEDLEITESS